jgi:hypothetical protein
MATQYALLNASFLKTSDLMVLQALILFNTAIQNHDSRVIWILTGVAHRIGQRIGLHRDPATLGLDPFTCEIRRRVWWQILMQDGFAEKLAGAGGSILFHAEVKRPSNVNDSDLFPGMEKEPEDRDGATEMMFFLIRCHIGQFLRGFANKKSNFDGTWNKLSTDAAALTAKDKAIDELEALYERKYLRFLDTSITWHFMCSYLVKAILAMLRFIAHNPEHHGAPRADSTQEEKDLLFRLSVDIITCQNLCYTSKEMQGFVWHVSCHFQWKAFIYMVNELRERTHGEEVDQAWKQVQLVYDVHPNFGADFSRRALSIAVGNLTLRAWDAYAATRKIIVEPICIQVLRVRETKRTASTSHPHKFQHTKPEVYAGLNNDPAMQLPSVPLAPDYPAANIDSLSNLQWDSAFAGSLEPMPIIPDLPPLNSDQMNWGVWNTLLADFEGGPSMDEMPMNVGTIGGAYEYGMPYNNTA